MPAPERLTIAHDDYHAEYVGHTHDGRQFFLTTPFEPGGNEYLALFLWDADGAFLEAKVENFGLRGTYERDAVTRLGGQWLTELGGITFGDVVIAPFSVERFGSQIGLIPDLHDDQWWVELLPGNYMAFFEPWDSGEYDT